MKIVLIGIQGSGKGTLVDGLKNHIDFDLMSTGQMLRDEIATGSELGKKIADVINAGRLVSLDMVLELVKKKIDGSTKDIIIFEGCPRDSVQYEALKQILDIDLVVYIDLAEDVAIERLLNRLTCKQCGFITNTSANKDKICPQCGGELVTRADDNMEAIKKRFSIFYNETLPLIQRFKDNGVRVVNVDGNLTPEERLNIVLKVINEYNN